MAPDKSSRVVFVGNIPYGLTEEQIIRIFSQAGNVLNFRLVHDRETGRPKGFGFAEYQDVDSAASAVRNLNDHETMGRKLRVDFSHEGGDEDTNAANHGASTSQAPNGTGPSGPAQQQNHSLPPLPAGVDLPPGVTCPDAISRTLSSLPLPQLLDIISQMKGLVMADPNKATELLTQAPQLSYAIFQALLLMGLVDAHSLQSVVEQTATQQPNPQGPPMPAAPPGTQQAHAQYPEYNQMQAPSAAAYGQVFPGTASAAPMAQSQSQTGATAAAAAPAQSAGLDKATLFQYVLSLTQEQLNAMQPSERDQILGVRQQIMSGALRL
ncbi:MAG: hypothetical protein M1815_000866 [Lichina confinis]|nr:MAG: hypothetical protein M1815_000866 [Lichina confinis]